MAIIGFNYNKLDAEKKAGAKATGPVEVRHNLQATDVQKADFKVAGSQSQVLRILFDFDIMYGSALGKISMKGEVIYTDTKEIIEETLKGWEDTKELNLTVKKSIHKFVYNKCIVRCIELADALNLPSPVPMPKFKYDGDGDKNSK